MLNEIHNNITHIWELEAKCSLDEAKKFYSETASKYAHELGEKGQLRFEWYVDEDKKSATFIENYKDINAVKERIKNHLNSHIKDEFPAKFDIKKLIVLGNLSPEMKKEYEGFGASFREKIGGFLK